MNYHKKDLEPFLIVSEAVAWSIVGSFAVYLIVQVVRVLIIYPML